MNWRQQAKKLQKEARFFYFVFKHPHTPWYAKWVAACTAGYLFSPIQMVPSFIPVIGFLDDLLVLFLGAKLVQRMLPQDVLIDCRQLARSPEILKQEQTRSWGPMLDAIVIATLWLAIVIATLWLVSAVTTATLMTVYIFR
jgi:uncharacterized membrane protein YkvA (DUF1232 family)